MGVSAKCNSMNVREGDVVDSVKIFLTSCLITTVSHAVCSHVGGPKILETHGP